MKVLVRQFLYTLFVIVAYSCFFGQFSWADGDTNNPYIDNVEIIKLDIQNSNGGVDKSTIVKVILNSFEISLKYRIIDIEMRDKNGIVCHFDHADFYSTESGNYFFKKLPFFLPYDEFEIIVHDDKSGEYPFYVRQKQYKTDDGSWSGKTNEAYDVSFEVVDNWIENFKIKQSFSGPNCSGTVEITISGGSYAGENWSFSTSIPGTHGFAYTYKGTFASNTVCNGTWDYHSNYCNASGNGTWAAYNTSPTVGPIPYIRANGFDGSLELGAGDSLNLTISLDAEDYEHEPADWWILQLTPDGNLYYFDLETLSMMAGYAPSLQVGLVSFTDIQILSLSGLQKGTHFFYFGIDLTVNGVLDIDSLYYDYVQVNVNGSPEITGSYFLFSSSNNVNYSYRGVAVLNQDRTWQNGTWSQDDNSIMINYNSGSVLTGELCTSQEKMAMGGQSTNPSGYWGAISTEGYDESNFSDAFDAFEWFFDNCRP